MELLISTMLSIMVMGATVTLFGVVGERINGGRAMIETSDRLRAVENRLHIDLLGHTASMLPWEQPSGGSGYFEILEGPAPFNLDASQQNPDGSQNVLLGYTQDVLMFTTRSPDQPFTGRFLTQNGNTTTVESPIAEVVWYLQPSFNAQGQKVILPTPTYTLYRRQFLVLPTGSPYKYLPPQFYENYDLSAHPDGQGNMVPNSLSDLTYRENRFAHNNAKFNAQAPFIVNATTLSAPSTSANYDGYSLTPFPVDSVRYGEDVVLTNVLSFDVKVWDPGAPVLSDADATAPHPLVPSDPGWKKGQAMNPAQYGAFVDLNYLAGQSYTPPSGAPISYFARPYFGLGQKSLLWAGAAGTNGIATYDSWSQGYECWAPGMDPSLSNLAFDGFDDGPQGVSGAFGVDNSAERLSSPPYPVPLRGIQIKIRVYEPSTRQVREVTITETFTPD